MRRGTLPALGVVVLLFVAGIAAYWALVPDRGAGSPSAPTLFHYEQTGAYTYSAHLKNNTLYGATNLTPGNGTLFTAITTWVNVTFVYRLAGAAAFAALSEIRLGVLLESPEWTKTLSQQATNVSITDGPLVTATLHVDLNVTNVTSLAGAIEKDTNYVPSSYQVVLEPTITTLVQYANLSESASFAPALSLNFTTGEIVPSRLSTNQPGNFLGASDPVTAAAPDLLPYLLLAAAAVGAVVLGLIAYGPGRPKAGPDLATLTRPFAEAIVETPSAPPAGPTVPVRTWEDLVKVADTLGCPILRLVPPGGTAASGAPAHFYVLADAVTYTYVHNPPAASRASPGPAAAARPAPAVPRAPALARPAPTTPPAPPSVRASPPRNSATVAAVVPTRTPPLSRPPAAPAPASPMRWDLSALVARAEQVRLAVRAMPPSTVSALAIEEAPDAMLARAVALARRGQLPAAEAILRRLRLELSGEVRPSVRSAPSWDRSGGIRPAPRGPT